MISPAVSSQQSLSHGSLTSYVELPEEISQLLHKYEHLFADPTALPPKRDADHSNRLIPRAQPVKVKPYRYSPIQKTKIEK